MHQSQDRENKLFLWGSSFLTETKSPPWVVHHWWPPSFHIGTRPEQGGQGASCQKDVWDHTLRFLSRDITVYVPFWFESNALESMQRLLIKDFRNQPTGITVRGGGLSFFVSYIIPAKVRVFPTGCMSSSATSSPELNYSFERASILNKVLVKSNVEQSRISGCLIT